MNENEQLLSRAEDLRARAERGEITCTPFLTPREQRVLARMLPLSAEEVRFDGGYAAAERARALFLPPYLAGADEALIEECLADTRAEYLIPLEIKGSGFRELAHKDFLGAILNLGIERDAIGDLCVTNGHTAVLFCDRVIATFLQENLTRVANDAVRVQKTVLPPDFDSGRKFCPVSDTVASPRADSVVAALAGVSRERAQALFREGLVEIDYETAQKTDKLLCDGTVVTVRGKGKFIIRSLSEQTKKGRIRLRADQYL